MSKIKIIIPSRLAATRLPNKPLIDIKGFPMVVHVAKRAIESDVGEVVVASGDQEICDVLKEHGIKSVLTDPSIPSGTDRVYAAFEKEGFNADYVINLQGDMPFIAPSTIAAVAELLVKNEADISTAATHIYSNDEIASPAVVKIAMSKKNHGLYFTRTANFPYNDGAFYKHLGIYGFPTKSLQRFVALPPSELERRENLEQLRALEDGMTINCAIVNDSPQSVDVPEDLKSL